MEFEYENRTGRVDPNSAWLNTPKKQPSFKSQNSNSSFNPQTYFNPQKQPSPTRSQAYPTPQTPVHKPPPLFSFSAVRDTPKHEFSSGPENQSSPENADNEDTPEPLKKSQLDLNDNVTVFRGHKTPSKRTSFFGSFASRFSPGRSGLRKRHEKEALVKKVHKRRRRENEREDRIIYRRSSEDSDSDHRSRQDSGSTAKPGPPQEVFLTTLINAMSDNPQLPGILLYYLQLLYYAFLLFLSAWVIYSFWATIKQDVDMKTAEQASIIMLEMDVCRDRFEENRCEKNSRVPAMKSMCESWERCMNKDPYKLGRAKISAHTFAEIINSFIEPISYKAMIFTTIVITLVYVIPNILFSKVRHTIQPTPQASYRKGSFQQGHAGYLDGSHHTSRPDRNYLEMGPAQQLEYNGSRSPSKNYEYR
ncbi:hypothetical protein MMC13_005610 [Lambiella insularis]|nr:hypothetical protein [Lambiella insularis]